MAHAERKSLVEALGWRARVTGHRVARRADWLLRPGRYPAPVLAVGGSDAFPHLVHARDLPVRRADRGVGVIDDPTLEAGKATNLALAAPAFDGLLLEPGRPLSFWRALGPATVARGYQPGTELRGGCLVPSVGGGLCLLSNALFEMAVALGFAVLERHAHSARVAEPATVLDATVFYPYVDLRVVPRHGRFRLEVAVTGGVLRLRAWSDAPRTAEAGAAAPVTVTEPRLLPVVGAPPRSCTTCGELTCWERRLAPRPHGGSR